MIREENPEITEKVEALYAASESLNRGDTMTHADVTAAIGLTRDHGRYRYIVRKWRAMLRAERGIEAWPDVDVGYRLCDYDEQINDIPRRRLIRSRRQVGRGKVALDALAGCKELSLHQRRRLAFQSEMTAKAQASIRGDLQRQAAFLKKKPDTTHEAQMKFLRHKFTSEARPRP